MIKFKVSMLLYFFYSMLLGEPSFSQVFSNENLNSLFNRKHQQSDKQNIPESYNHHYNSLNTVLPEFRVNEKAGGAVQEFPCIAQRGEFGYVMVWWDMRDRRAIWGQLFDADGEKIGKNFIIADERVGSIITDESKLRIAGNDSGEFVVIWNAGIPRYDSPDIVARKFKADATPYSEPFLVTQDDRPIVNIYPDVVVNNDGSFVCVWKRTDLTFGPNAVWAKWYNADCTSKGDSILITDDGEKPALTGSGDGEITLLWASNYGYQGEAYIERFDATGTKVWGPIHVSQSTGAKLELEIEENITGDLALSWVRYQGKTRDIVLRYVNSQGTPKTEEKIINDIAGKAGSFSQGPSLSAINNEYFIVWPDHRNDQYEIWGQIIDSLGNHIGTNFKISDSAEARSSSLSYNDNVGIAAWQDKGRNQEDIILKTFTFSDDIYIGNSVLVNDDKDDAQQGTPRIDLNDINQMVIVWNDFRDRSNQIFLQRFTGTGEFIGENYNATQDQTMLVGGPTLCLNNYGKIHIGFTEFCAMAAPSYVKIMDFNDVTTDTFLHIAGHCDEGAMAAEFLPVDSAHFIAAWSEGNIYRCKFNYKGELASDLIKVNSDSVNGYNWIHGLDGNANGQSIVLYQSYLDSSFCTYVQKFDTRDELTYQRIRVNNDCSPTGQESAISINSDGDFFVVWTESQNDACFIHAKFYHWDNTEPYFQGILSEIGSFSNWTEPDVSVNDENDIAVIWDSFDGYYWNVLGQRLNSSGKRLGNNFIVGSPPIGTNQISPRLSFKDELLYITWLDDREAEIRENYDVYATILDYNNVVSVSSEKVKSVTEIELEQNYPNPFNSETLIKYHLKKTSKVELDIFNSTGQKVLTIIKQVQNAGRYSVFWNGKNDSQESVSSGVYFYRIKADDFIEVRKMLLIR